MDATAADDDNDDDATAAEDDDPDADDRVERSLSVATLSVFTLPADDVDEDPVREVTPTNELGCTCRSWISPFSLL